MRECESAANSPILDPEQQRQLKAWREMFDFFVSKKHLNSREGHDKKNKTGHARGGLGRRRRSRSSVDSEEKLFLEMEMSRDLLDADRSALHEDDSSFNDSYSSSQSGEINRKRERSHSSNLSRMLDISAVEDPATASSEKSKSAGSSYDEKRNIKSQSGGSSPAGGDKNKQRSKSDNAAKPGRSRSSIVPSAFQPVLFPPSQAFAQRSIKAADFSKQASKHVDKSQDARGQQGAEKAKEQPADPEWVPSQKKKSQGRAALPQAGTSGQLPPSHSQEREREIPPQRTSQDADKKESSRGSQRTQSLPPSDDVEQEGGGPRNGADTGPGFELLAEAGSMVTATERRYQEDEDGDVIMRDDDDRRNSSSPPPSPKNARLSSPMNQLNDSQHAEENNYHHSYEEEEEDARYVTLSKNVPIPESGWGFCNTNLGVL